MIWQADARFTSRRVLSELVRPETCYGQGDFFSFPSQHLVLCVSISLGRCSLFIGWLFRRGKETEHVGKNQNPAGKNQNPTEEIKGDEREIELKKLADEIQRLENEHKRVTSRLAAKMKQLAAQNAVLNKGIQDNDFARHAKAFKTAQEHRDAKKALEREEKAFLERLDAVEQRRLEVFAKHPKPDETPPVLFGGRWYRKDALGMAREKAAEADEDEASDRLVGRLEDALKNEFAFKDLTKTLQVNTFRCRQNVYSKAKGGGTLPLYTNNMQIKDMEYDFASKRVSLVLYVSTQDIDPSHKLYNNYLNAANDLLEPTYILRCSIPVAEESARKHKELFQGNDLVLTLSYRITQIKQSRDARTGKTLVIVDAVTTDAKFSKKGAD